jgi:GWxTD domain-containing protein
MRQLIHFLFLALIVFAGFESLSAAGHGSQDKSEKRRQEESEDYYSKWLNQDVVYIITPEERGVFEKLTTPDEKERFIEQFWLRRDPDLSTPENEYKEEHYRRIAYANEHFAAGAPGWRTDRGRIYIIHGPPSEIEAHSMGQSYDRPANEGGGHTVTYPFQIWRYRHLDGIGDNVEIEFVDPDGTNTFHLATTPWEKDALLMVPGAGKTIAEELGMATRADHPYFRPYSADNYFGMQRGELDDPFVRYERLVRIQKSEPIKYKDLKELVSVNISYDSLPFKARSDFFRLGPQQVLTSLSLDVLNKELSFKPENGVDTARVAVYGVVTSISNSVVSEFDDDLAVSYRPDQLDEGRKGRAVYQKVLLLDSKLRYRLDLIIKDLNSNKVGHQRIGLIPPRVPADRLVTSSLVLADEFSQVKDISKSDEMFLIGDVKVRPNLRKVFAPKDPLWVYLQAYNVQLDQASMKPALTVTYRLLRPDGSKALEFTDRGGDSIEFFSSQRVVLVKRMPLEGLSDGRYELSVEIKDELSGQSAVAKDNLDIKNEGS